MAAQTKAGTQGYSAQVRASQYDPEVDVAYYNYQQQQQQQQQQQATSPRSSQDLSRPIPNYHDHYPISSSSGTSTATTFINLTCQNNSSNAFADASTSPEGFLSSSPALASHGEQTISLFPSSVSPPTSGTDSISPPLSSSVGNGSRPMFSKLSAAAILKTAKVNQPSSSAASSQPQSPILQNVNVNQVKHQHSKHHSKSGSVTSVRSKLVDRGSRSSLQLNLRTSQQSQYPTMATSPGLMSPGGIWDDSQLAPSPLHPKMDPVFMMEHQMQQKQQQKHMLSPGTETLTTESEKQMARMSMMSVAMNRQDDARLQLEQERAFQKARQYRIWTRSKFLLFVANTILLIYSVASTVVMVMSWKGIPWTKAYLDSGIMIIANRRLLYLMMVTAPFGVFVSLVGYIGILAQSRKVLSIYSILLWPLFALITSVGYICFRRNHTALYQKLKSSWINEYTRDDRIVIQNAFSCCGYRSLGDYPSFDLRCFPRAPLPPCESLFLQYQQDLLSNTSSAAFSILPVQLLIMVVALLCSNHIDNLYRSGNPITPKLYTQ